jgi:hypothetical protein
MYLNNRIVLVENDCNYHQKFCMRFVVILLLLFFSFQSFSQENEYIQPRGIWRASITVPIGVTANLGYEIKLKKNLTLTPQASVFSYFRTDKAKVLSNQPDYVSPLVAGIFSAELRCYFNLNRRTIKHKKVINYSAAYLGLQPYTASDPFVKGIYALDYEGNNGAFLNIGFQKQFNKHFYYNIFGGALLGSRSFKGSYAANVDPAHLGVTIGYTF